MSAVIPRPVGPTIDWNASATTTASRPRSRTQVCPYQVISIPLILTGAAGLLIGSEQPMAVDEAVCSGADSGFEAKKRPGAPAQSVPPVGGREDGTSKGSVRHR